MSRTPEEREAARLERDRRRAAREGRPAAAAPDDRHSLPAQQAENVDHHTAPAHDPQATQVFDVTSAWTGEHAAVAAPEAQALAPEPAPVEPAAPEAQALAPEPAPVEPAAPEAQALAPEPARVEPAAPELAPEPEQPLGTRRVSRHERPVPPATAKPRARRGRAQASAPPAPPRGGARGPGSAAGRPRWGLRIAALLALAAIVLAGWFLWQLYQPGKGDGSGRVAVTVPKGASVGQIGDLLAAKGVIDSPFFFRLRARLAGSGGDLKSGSFTLKNDMSYAAALEALSRNPAPPPTIRIAIPEGKSRQEVATLARQAGLRGDYLAASRGVTQAFDPRRYGAPKGATLEGFLFPATYELRRGATAKDLVAAQLRAFRQNLAQVNLRYARSKNLTVFDVLDIAAMVEREVEVGRERPLVAAVIYNRLHDGMPLGIDATLRYALHDWTHPLTVSQLASQTPYNTRNHQGLPPGPIGNPGLASIEAAARPAHVPYLFYVVKPGTCGQHAFSATDAQFERDVQRYNSARAAAGGKSPTKC
jgi:UPF0755 protein